MGVRQLRKLVHTTSHFVQGSTAQTDTGAQSRSPQVTTTPTSLRDLSQTYIRPADGQSVQVLHKPFAIRTGDKRSRMRVCAYTWRSVGTLVRERALGPLWLFRCDVLKIIYSIIIQYNTIQYNTIQYNTIQYNTIQYNTIQYNTTQHNTTQHNTTQHNTTQHTYNTTCYNIRQYLSPMPSGPKAKARPTRRPRRPHLGQKICCVWGSQAGFVCL